MPSLFEVQRDFANSLRNDDPASLLPYITGPANEAAERIAVHSRHMHRSLERVLAGTFPVTVQVVGEGFFAFAASAFVRAHPPNDPNLARFGALFAYFLNGFAPSAHLEYLPDLARLEWMLHLTSLEKRLPSVAIQALVAISPEDVPRLTLRLQPSLRYFTSAWSIDEVYDAHGFGSEPGVERTISADQGPVWLQIGPKGFCRLSRGTHRFRDMLAHGAALEHADASARMVEPEFDLSAELATIVGSGLVTGFLVPLRDHGEGW
jgi:hypothetical protein